MLSVGTAGSFEAIVSSSLNFRLWGKTEKTEHEMKTDLLQMW